MKKIVVKDAAVSPGMEYISTSYPGDGVYWVAQKNQIVVVIGSLCMAVTISPSMIVQENENIGGGGGPSEGFVLALIDKTAELVRCQPLRSVRESDRRE